jgi:hypothetical protein
VRQAVNSNMLVTLACLALSRYAILIPHRLGHGMVQDMGASRLPLQ